MRAIIEFRLPGKSLDDVWTLISEAGYTLVTAKETEEQILGRIRSTITDLDATDFAYYDKRCFRRTSTGVEGIVSELNPGFVVRLMCPHDRSKVLKETEDFIGAFLQVAKRTSIIEIKIWDIKQKTDIIYASVRPGKLFQIIRHTLRFETFTLVVTVAVAGTLLGLAAAGTPQTCPANPRCVPFASTLFGGTVERASTAALLSLFVLLVQWLYRVASERRARRVVWNISPSTSAAKGARSRDKGTRQDPRSVRERAQAEQKRSVAARCVAQREGLRIRRRNLTGDSESSPEYELISSDGSTAHFLDVLSVSDSLQARVRSHLVDQAVLDSTLAYTWVVKINPKQVSASKLQSLLAQGLRSMEESGVERGAWVDAGELAPGLVAAGVLGAGVYGLVEPGTPGMIILLPDFPAGYFGDVRAVAREVDALSELRAIPVRDGRRGPPTDLFVWLHPGSDGALLLRRVVSSGTGSSPEIPLCDVKAPKVPRGYRSLWLGVADEDSDDGATPVAVEVDASGWRLDERQRKVPLVASTPGAGDGSDGAGSGS